MDRITKQLITDYLSSEGIKSSAVEDDFEVFTNYCVISKEYNRTFDARSITVGSGNDTGIDGLGIIVNGFLVEEADEVSDLLEQNGYLDVSFVFIQSKHHLHSIQKKSGHFVLALKIFFQKRRGLSETQILLSLQR
jgi:hypothetical protein